MHTFIRRITKSSLALAAIIALTVASLLPIMKVHALGDNLVANPSVETASGSNPANWTFSSWGTNTVSPTWETTGKDGSRSLKVNMTAYSNGDAKWMSSPITVKPSTTYQLSDWYIANVKTSIELAYTSTTGAVTYGWVADAATSTAWKQAVGTFTTPANVASVSIYHVLNAKGTLQTDMYELRDTTVTTPTNPSAPTVSISAPAANATISGTQTISATASGSPAIAGVQFKVDSTNVGAEDTTSPYSVSLDTKTLTNGTHTLSAVARNTSNVTTTASISVTVNNTTTQVAPTVAVTAPANNATVSGSQAISATATTTTGTVAGVQFKVDSTNLGAEDTISPYSTTLDTKTLTNGTHTISATGRGSNGLTATSTVTVTVNNTTTTPTDPANLIANPSVETAESATKPQDWTADSWGTNTVAFSYPSTGHTGSRSLKTEITAYTNGDAKWDFTNVAVTAGKNYQYSNWYQSNVDTELDAAVTLNDGTVQYYYLTTASASTAWNKVSAQFTAPANAKSITIFQVLAKKGYIVSDDFSFAAYTPAAFNRGLVSLTFDDGWRSQYTGALPALQKYNMNATFFLLTSTIDYPDYMTVAQMQALKNAGNELDSHTVDHPHMPQLTVAKMDTELSQSQTQLRQWFGSTVADDFATPYGEYNSTVVTEIKKYYRSHRSTDEGYNSKDNFDIYNVRVQNILNTTTTAQVKAWVDQANKDHTWLVLVYHEVGTATEDPTYSVTPANLDAQLAAIKASGITVKTYGTALDEVKTQL